MKTNEQAPKENAPERTEVTFTALGINTNVLVQVESDMIRVGRIKGFRYTREFVDEDRDSDLPENANEESNLEYAVAFVTDSVGMAQVFTEPQWFHAAKIGLSVDQFSFSLLGGFSKTKTAQE